MREEPRSRPFTRLDPESYRRTLAQKLSGNRLVDPLRDLLTRFGLRPYEVRVVRLRWSGGARGEGEPFVEREWPILPTPKIDGLDGLTESIEGPGVQETGTATVTKISTEYSEEDLRGLLKGELQFPGDSEAFWEITFYGKRDAKRRRFNLVGVPSRHTLGWECRLEKALGDRDEWSKNLPPGERLYDGP